MTNFDDVVGGDDLSPEEETRLRRVHDLLMQAGPPPDLPPALERPPTEPAEAEIVQFPMLPRRRWALAAVVAATVALLAFAGGYFTGHSKPTSFKTTHIVPMHGGNALALLRIGHQDGAGNWPMQLEVNNLPRQPKPQYYELWLSRKGKPVAPCGSFRVNQRTTTVQLSVPYNFSRFDGWVVTKQGVKDRAPGPVVLRT
jgi:hypothetical protein